jgi:hypothetical protein
MSCVIVLVAIEAQSPPMSWEEDTLMDRLRGIFRSRLNSAKRDNDARRRRSNRMRYFLTVFGSEHWAERVEGRRT